MKFTVTELSHDDIVNILSDGLYGSNWLSSDYKYDDYDKVPVESRMGDCYEDKMADILLNGGKITLVDTYADGLYETTLDDLLRACSTNEGLMCMCDIMNERDDACPGSTLLQIAMFGEIIYG